MDKNKRREMRLKIATCSSIIGVLAFVLLLFVVAASLAGMRIGNSTTVVLGIIILATATLAYALQMPNDSKSNSFYEDDDFNPWKDY